MKMKSQEHTKFVAVTEEARTAAMVAIVRETISMVVELTV
jgi:hypothetical protein